MLEISQFLSQRVWQEFHTPYLHALSQFQEFLTVLELVLMGWLIYMVIRDAELIKSQKLGGKVKSSRCKARKYEGMRRTYRCAAVTEDAAQHRRWTFYEAVRDGLGLVLSRYLILTGERSYV